MTSQTIDITFSRYHQFESGNVKVTLRTHQPLYRRGDRHALLLDFSEAKHCCMQLLGEVCKTWQTCS